MSDEELSSIVEEDPDKVFKEITEKYGSVWDFINACESETEFRDKRPREKKLSGHTEQIETGYGYLYVTINEDEEGNPIEVFSNIGESGGFTSSFTEALTQVISVSLRSGVHPEEIIDELVGTRSPKSAYDEGIQVKSIPEAIGIALARHMGNDELIEGDNELSNRTKELVESVSEKDSSPDID